MPVVAGGTGVWEVWKMSTEKGYFLYEDLQKFLKKELSDFKIINYETRAARRRLTATGNKSQSGRKIIGPVDKNI